jgi:hypothetical protein
MIFQQLIRGSPPMRATARCRHRAPFSIFVLLTTKFQPRLNVLAGMGGMSCPNDELELKANVLEKRESRSKPDRGIIRNQIHLRNQKREMVLQCISNILVARRPNAKAST